VANKIGTYGVAVLCRAHKVPFYVAAPRSTVDPSVRTGRGIPIEERDGGEVTHLMGTRVAPRGVAVYNPAFDVTPAKYVSAIVTERGVLRPPLAEGIRKLFR
jgi:methylthioribose-1-phosphate isomerase